MEQAAAEADRKGDHHAAILCWTRLTELDPLSARYAAGRMRALVEADDRGGALVHARQLDALVRRELETEVETAITSLDRGPMSHSSDTSDTLPQQTPTLHHT